MNYNFDLDISKAHLEAAGWSLEDHIEGNPFDTHVIYIHDFRCDGVKLITVKRDHFEGPRSTSGPSEAALFLGTLAKRAFEGAFKGDEHACLAGAIVAYLRTTQTFHLWRRDASPTERMHAVLNIYPGSGSPWVRPFILRCEGTVIDALELKRMTNGVAASDKARHPDWF
ncbi:hypothetical protein [Pseudomonas hunanensis]|uniref:hypothetical protein n=1 Tax=Pseudomonas hunanensis TaxID=1247546 RepID=UPI0030DBAC7A